MNWIYPTNSVLCNQFYKLNSIHKIYAFDLDGTLIKTHSGNKFPKSSLDIVFNYSNIVQKLTELHNDNYTIIIFTNQLGLRKKRGLNETDWIKKTNWLINKLPFNVYIYASLEEDIYRKPSIGMWELFCKMQNYTLTEKDVYVGDAAGREEDFSSSDYKFAKNIGIEFKTPEQFFLNIPSPFNITHPIFTPSSIKPHTLNLNFQNKTLIIMVGAPASGKSSLSNLIGFPIINQDTLKTKSKCLKATKEILSKGGNAIIDNTNPSKTVRNEYISIAKHYGISVKCIHFYISREFTQHLNITRMRLTGKKIPKIAYSMYYSKYEEPTKEEGFDDIITITNDNYPIKFKSAEHEKAYAQYS